MPKPGGNPFVKSTGVSFVNPKRNADGSGKVIVLDRVEPGVKPDYCTHGKVSCWFCDDWCWLGDKTHALVVSGEAAPMCRECAMAIVPKDSTPLRNVEDHR